MRQYAIKNSKLILMSKNGVEILINNKYVINQKIGKGSFGDVHIGYHRDTREPVAIKLEHQSKKIMLEHENSVYHEICGIGNAHIPKIYWYGNEGEYRVMVMEALGDSLETLFNKCNRHFSLKTTVMIGLQIFDLLEHLHRCGFIHRDLKPENFLIGLRDNRHFIYMIDFGLTKRYKNQLNVHTKMITGKKLVGTARYASINSHNGIELSRRDDLESLIYLLVYFLKGSLPWQGLPGRTREEKYEIIKQRKVNTTTRALCVDMPSEFVYFLDHVRSLEFKEKPNYKYLRSLLVKLFDSNGLIMDYHYDWVH